MDHLFNNPDMSDLTIAATDPSWSWGQTNQEFIVRSSENVVIIVVVVVVVVVSLNF